jgi:hypothetical protein
MRVFVIHRRDGCVDGIVTTEADDAPPVVGTGDASQIVTEGSMPEGAIALADSHALADPDYETRALEALRAVRIEHRLVMSPAAKREPSARKRSPSSNP